jgi:polyhydroxyalkanoate synthesis regulator phasin
MADINDNVFRDPGIIAAMAAVITLAVTKLADGLLKRTSFQLDDGAALRKELMAENRQLREEVRNVYQALSDLRKSTQIQIDAQAEIIHKQQHEIDRLSDLLSTMSEEKS